MTSIHPNPGKVITVISKHQDHPITKRRRYQAKDRRERSYFWFHTNLTLQSFVNTIDTVLIPPANAQAVPLPINAGNIAAVFGPTPSVAQQAAAVQGFAPTAGLITQTAG